MPPTLVEISIVLVDRATIKSIHAEFFRDPTATDVITFPYGEILVCPAVARDEATTRDLALNDEILLYALHGLLHLTGLDDRTASGRARMNREQTRLLKRLD